MSELTKSKKSKLEIALNMGAAAHALGVDVAAIKRAKRGGCEAFLRSGRIDLAKLRAWLKDNPPLESGHPELLGVDLSGLEASLDAAVEVEGRTLSLLRSAQDRADAVAVEALTSACGRARRDRMKTEQFIREERTRRGELMTFDEHRQGITRLWVPAVNLMRKLPRTAAAKANPADDVLAEKEISRAMEEIIAEMHRSLTFTPDPELHLRTYVAATMREAGGLEKVLDTFAGWKKSLLEESKKTKGGDARKEPANEQ